MKIIQETTFEKVRKAINQSRKTAPERSNLGYAERPIIFSSNNDELNRKVLEKLRIDILLINLEKRKDFQKQRNSGFNQILAKIAKKNNITIGINFDELIDAPERSNFGYAEASSFRGHPCGKRHKNKSEILARIQQNIMLCNKNKLKMKFIAEKHNRNIYDLKSLGLILGMPTNMMKFL
jgi:RNase P/RNase MRP subunit p30